jgi:hypothetical protein
MPAEAAKLDWPELLNEALTAPGRLGDTYCRFRDYSFLNQLLLLQQGVTEPVATYRKWTELGRQVLKGSKARAIIRPIIVNKKVEDGSDEEKFLRFKRVNCLFPVSDTEGDELPPFEIPTWDYKLALERLDITEVPFRSLDGNCQGMSRGRAISINPVAKYPLKTRMHECSHVVLGHTVVGGHEDYRSHRGIREFEAESSAYLLMNELSLTEFMDPAESREYIQTWMNDERPPDLSIRNVFKTVDVILKSGRAVTEASEDGE